MIYGPDGIEGGSDFAFASDVIEDINGDGLAEILIGARYFDGTAERTGTAYVVFGKDSSEEVSVDVLGASGFRLIPEAAEYGALGAAVSRLGDINGDGAADFAVAAPGIRDAESTGRVYVVFSGPDLADIELTDIATGTAEGLILDDDGYAGMAGSAISGVADMNGDGLDEIVVGAYRSDAIASAGGRAYVVFGTEDSGRVSLADVAAGLGGYAIEAESEDDLVGASVAGLGDINGDGLPDVAVGAYTADFSGAAAGRAYVVFGKSDGAAVLLGDVASGTGGFSMDGTERARAGSGIADAGDVDGDGICDVLIAARTAAGPTSGTAYVVFGGGALQSLALDDVVGLGRGIIVDGDGGGDFAAESVRSAGDVDGDGLDDFVVSARGLDPGGGAFVVMGRVDAFAATLQELAAGGGALVIEGLGSPDGWFGVQVAAGLDVNGEGAPDVVVSAPFEGAGQAIVRFL